MFKVQVREVTSLAQGAVQALAAKRLRDPKVLFKVAAPGRRVERKPAGLSCRQERGTSGGAHGSSNEFSAIPFFHNLSVPNDWVLSCTVFIPGSYVEVTHLVDVVPKC